jgi:hypothetical protein
MSQRFEKVAQRRIEERSERIRNAQKARFDLKLNPFFSRPSHRVIKESEHLQESPRGLITIPTDPLKSNNNNNNKPKQIIIRKTNRLSTKEDDDESGILVPEINYTDLYETLSAIIKRPIIKSATSCHRTTTTTESIKKLKPIFPSDYKTKYRHLVLLDKIAHIYIQLVVILGHKTMTGVQFRSFAKYVYRILLVNDVDLFLNSICGILNETILAPSIDILYYQILRKWQQFVLRTPSTGRIFILYVRDFGRLTKGIFDRFP